jgi:hypothetical protein
VTQKNQSQENQFLERRNGGSVPESSQVKFGVGEPAASTKITDHPIGREADN